jgi:hypothetical protein
MKHQEKESAALRKNIGTLSLVQSQLVLAEKALFSVNKDATEVITRGSVSIV